MRIPADAVIPPEKLTQYLLRFRPWDDKSRFLSSAGFAATRPEILENAIRVATATSEAVEDGENDYGMFYRVDGELVKPNGRFLSVVIIWLQWKLDGKFHFVTLKPR